MMLDATTDPSLSSDMLLSMNLGQGPEMSVQPSLHIGLAPRDLQLSKFELPSDEEMAKGMYGWLRVCRGGKG